jgi:hypothetical protein
LRTVAAVGLPAGASTPLPVSATALPKPTQLPLRPALNSKLTAQAAVLVQITQTIHVHLVTQATCAERVHQDMVQSSHSHAGNACRVLLLLCCMCWLFV